jgi:hypothetical protein
MENQESPKKEISTKKRIPLVILTLFLLITTLCFGYLYLAEDEDIEDTDYTELVDTEKEIDDKEVVCDFNDITRQVTEDTYSRVHFAYEFILKPNASPENPYTACKETLKTIIQNIIENEKNPEIPSDRLISTIEYNHIEYLIDDIFIVYSFGDIWSIDIINETVDLLWKTQGSGLAISQLYAISEKNVSRLFFSTHPLGLGGTEEDTKAINNAIKTMCEAGDLGTFVYDTSTEEVEKLYDAEECTEMNL